MHWTKRRMALVIFSVLSLGQLASAQQASQTTCDLVSQGVSLKDLTAYLATPGATNKGGLDISFDIPEPTAKNMGRELRLWSTYYRVSIVKEARTGLPLLDKSGKRLGPLLTTRDWCNAALEGTARVTGLDGQLRVYNYSAHAPKRQVDCTPFFPKMKPSKREALGHTRYEVARSPYGTGVQGMLLVPYRTIAVDQRQDPIPYGSVIYIPEARGREIPLPSGQVVKHDGYFYAADTGGAIQGNHIDVFAGLFTGNPFPNFVKSVPTGTFRAFFINDKQIADSLKKTHTIPAP